MNTTLLMDFIVDKDNNKILVKREFDAPRQLVWSAWTESNILDQWWAPKPYRAETKYMDFSEGGHWLYAMVGPENDKQWCRENYISINPMQNFKAEDAFCDVDGNINDAFPRMIWDNSFVENNDSTMVEIEITFKKIEDLEKIVKMGFKEGFTAGLENLDHYLATQFLLRKQNKANKKAR